MRSSQVRCFPGKQIREDVLGLFLFGKSPSGKGMRINMHRIVFEGVENDWHNALPLGNGRMGAMVFRKGNAVHVALNHYDCYYKRYENAKDQEEKEPVYEELCSITEQARLSEGYERTHYLRTLHPGQEKQRPSYQNTSYPMAGEVVIRFSKAIDTDQSSLSLEIEAGRVIFQAGSEKNKIHMEAFVPWNENGVLIKLEQEGTGLLWEEAELMLPSAKGLGNTSVSDLIQENQLVLHTDYHPEKEAEGIFHSETAVSVKTDCGTAVGKGCIRFSNKPKLVLSACVSPVRGSAVEQNKVMLSDTPGLAESHRNTWKAFWNSSIRLPDRFLETLWYVSLYLLKCCSPEDGRFREQGCGLCGLWDIRRPNLWGSMWYWDVNIQTAYQGVFHANQLELAKQFCDAYLSYEPKIRDYTRRVYGREGWALDYPHTLYHCIQPWCAQFLWNYYLFSQDREFLETKAYPVIREQIAFFKSIAKEDAEGRLHIDPDISPEQGPVTRDSVISLACIRKLLKMGIKGAEILERPKKEKEELEELCKRLSAYPETADHKRFKDSGLVQEEIFLRHPSVLMPVFPAGEISRESESSIFEKARETLLYAAENTEIGTFGYSWLACGAAALGEGDFALCLLYEKGLDHILHSNGLGYEESERFINYCHITKQSNYLPAMCEAGGGIISTVNTMLLSFGEDRAIRVFPALPKGKKIERPEQCQYQPDDCFTDKKYKAWNDACFHRLLAPGGFQVSACLKNRRVTGIQVFSEKGGILRLCVPKELSEEGKETLLIKNMEPGETALIGTVFSEEQEVKAPQVRKAAGTGRRIFLGENRHTAFYKAWDAFICPYQMGDQRQQQMTPYLFDFTVSQHAKDYLNVYHRQYYRNQKCPLYAAGPVTAGLCLYLPELGYGFDSLEGLEGKDRKEPDDIRRDFIQGIMRREFLIELPKGKYNLLLISGDETEPSLTTAGLPGNGLRVAGKDMGAGYYQCRILPVFHENDGILRISLDTERDRRWKLNALIVNKEYALL